MAKERARRRPGRPPSDEAPEGERRAHILRAADEHFSRRGYAAVSIGEIAADVGVSKAAIYHHFPSKHALYAAFLLEALGAIAAGIGRTTEAPGPVRPKIRALVEFPILRVPIEGDLDSLMRDAEEHLPPALRREIARAEGRMWEALEDLMRRGIADGELKGREPRVLAHAFWHMLYGFVGRRAREAGFWGRREVADAVADLFLEGAAVGRGGDSAGADAGEGGGRRG